MHILIALLLWAWMILAIITLFINVVKALTRKPEPPVYYPPPAPVAPPQLQGPFDMVRYMEGDVRAERTEKIERFEDGRIRAERHDIIEGRLRQPSTLHISVYPGSSESEKKRIRAEMRKQQREQWDQEQKQYWAERAERKRQAAENRIRQAGC